MMDKLKPGTKAWNDRQRRHRHNGFMGSTRMMQMQLQTILKADSVSEGTKYFAVKMLVLSVDLAEGLKTRIDS